MSDYKVLCKYKVLHRHIIINHWVKWKRKRSGAKGRRELTRQGTFNYLGLKLGFCQPEHSHSSNGDSGTGTF